MIDRALVRRTYRSIAQLVILALVFTGYSPLLATARASRTTAGPAFTDDLDLSLRELTITDRSSTSGMAVHGPPLDPQPIVEHRPTAPQQAIPLLGAQWVDTGAFSVTVVVSTGQGYGVHQDPTISLDGDRIAFWSTGDLYEGQGPGYIVINEIQAFQTVRMIELYNDGPGIVNLRDWRLIEYNDSGAVQMDYLVPYDFMFAPGEYMYFYNYGSPYQGSYYIRTGFYYIYGNGINQGGALLLQNASATSVDFVRWGNSEVSPPSGHWSGENPPAPRYYYPVYQTLGRDRAGADTDSGKDWCLQSWTLGYQNQGCHNPDGNIEAFLAEIQSAIDIDYTQLSVSKGSILGGFNLKPSISSDGTRIAFFSDRNLVGTNQDENFEIFAYEIGTQKLIQVTDSSRGANILPSINEDGTRIAFVSDRHLDPSADNRDGNLEIFVAEVDYATAQVTFTQVTHTSGTTINDQPSINADGTRIAFVSDQDGNLEIYWILVGGSPVQVTSTDEGVVNEQPAINGTGSRITFVSTGNQAGQNADGNQEIFWVQVNAANGAVQSRTQATSTPITATNDLPAMHPDGDRIVFVRDQNVLLYYPEHDIEIQVAEVTTTTIYPSRPAVGGAGGYEETYVAFTAGGQLYRVFTPLADVYISKQASSGTVAPGQVITYTIKFGNWSTDDATSVQVTDTFPLQVEPPFFTYGGVPISLVGGSSYPNYAWNVGDLSYGDTGYITAVVQVRIPLAAGIQIVNRAAIATALVEPFEGNNRAEVAVTVENVGPVVAKDDGYTTTEDSTLYVTGSSPITSVLSNDIDLNNDPLMVAAHTQPTSGGTVDVDADGYFTYTPPTDFYGIDTFTYVASDGWLTDSAVVSITVISVNDSPVNWIPGTQETQEETTLTFSIANSNVISVSDVDAGSNAIQVTLTVADGTLTLGGTGGLSFSVGDGTDDITMTFAGPIATINTALDGLVYSPTLNFSGTTSLQIVSNDQGYSGSPGPQIATDTLSITVIGVNDDPVAVDDSYSTDEDTPVNETAPGVLGNDTDVDIGDIRVVSSYSPTSTQGMAIAINADGSFIYDPTIVPAWQAMSVGDSVVDTFTYTVSDGHGGYGTALVTITINGANDSPQAVDDGYSTDEDSMLTVAATGVLSNDTDVDIADTLSVTSFDATSSKGASVTVNADGSFTYNPIGVAALQALTASQTTTDTFTYTVGDGSGGTDTATVVITVTGINDAPELDLDYSESGNDADEIYEGGSLPGSIAPRTVVTDVDTDIARATVSLSLSARPDGTSELLACGDCDTYFLTHSYNPASGVLYITGPRSAAIYQAVLRSVTYDNTAVPPSLGDRFAQVVIYDTTDITATAASTITLSNSAPNAQDDITYTLEENAATIYVLANDNDYDGDPLTITLITLPAHGTAVTVSLPLTTAIVYTPDHNFDGTDVFSYTITDGNQTATARVTVVVTGVNDPPTNTVPFGTPSTGEDTALTFTGVGSRFAITDVDAYANNVQVALTVTQGTLTLSGVSGLSFSNGDGTNDITMVFSGAIGDINTALDGMVFSPTLNYNGPASITIRTDDLGNTGLGSPGSDEDIVPINILPQPDDPQFTSTPVPTATLDTLYTYDITATDPDIGDALAITAPTRPAWLTLVDNGNGTATLSGTPAFSDRGLHAVTLQVEDSTGRTDTQSFTITVLAPELSVAKYASHLDPLLPGSSITYTIIISNVGSLVATNVTVSDTEPTNTDYIMGSSQIIPYRAGEAGAYLDQFTDVSYSNSYGTTDWSGTPWAETNDDGSPVLSSGSKIWVYSSGDTLRFHGTSNTDTFWIERPVDLRGVATATLEFRYDEDATPEATDQFTVSVFDGATWHVLLSESGNFGGWHTFGPQSIITYANSDTRIRFQVTGFSETDGGTPERVEVDDVEVAWERRPIAAGRTPPGLVIAADGYDLQPGEFLTVTFAVVVDPGLAADSSIVNTASVACTGVSTPTDAAVTSTATLPRISFSSSTYSVGEGGVQAVITVTQNAPSNVETRANYVTSGGTAQAGSDYAASSGTLIFSPGTTTLTFTVSINDDTLDEDDETVNLALTSPLSAILGTPNVATLTIIDNDPLPSLSIADVSVVEGRTGSANAVFTVTLSAQSGRTVAVNYVTQNGTAVAGTDYTANSGTLNFAPGVTTRWIIVAVQGDAQVEIDDTFFVNLSGPIYATIADGQGTGTILNDDHLITAVEDTWLDSTNPTTAHGSDNLLQVQPDTAITVAHTLIDFDLSSIPSTTAISYAALFIYEDNANADQAIRVHRVITDWAQSQATWQDRLTGTSWNTAGGDYAPEVTSFAANATGWRQVDITALVQGWIDETYDMYGLLLRSTTTGSTNAVQFRSREGANAPYLYIEY